MLLLDRVEEEIEMLTQGLDRLITWACQHQETIMKTINDLKEASSQAPIDQNNQFASILPSFPMKGRLQLLHSELNRYLTGHKQLMIVWMPNVEQLWRSTQSRHTKSTHPWFDVIATIKDKLSHGVSDIDDALERLDFVEDDPDPPDDEERVQNHDWVTDDDVAPGGG